MRDVQNIIVHLKLFTTVGFWRLATSFTAVFGLVWMLIEPMGLFFPDKLHIGWYGYIGLAFVSLVGAVSTRWPRRTICERLASPDTIIEIVIGDLFDFSKRAHLVIGTNDVFDTELGDIIKPTSVQGQFLTQVYNGDNARLSSEVVDYR